MTRELTSAPTSRVIDEARYFRASRCREAHIHYFLDSVKGEILLLTRHVNPDTPLPVACPRVAGCRDIIDCARSDASAGPVHTLRPLSAIVGTVVRLCAAENKAILVSSGPAISVGLQ